MLETPYEEGVVKSELANFSSDYWQKHGLNQSPFDQSTQYAMYYPSAQSQQHLEYLKLLPTVGKRLVLITGSLGCGKSMLAAQYMAQDRDGIQICFLKSNIAIRATEVITTVSNTFGIPNTSAEATLPVRFHSLLMSLEHLQKQGVLWVEDAHRLPLETLNAILQLIFEQTPEKIHLHAILSGEPHLKTRIKSLMDTMSHHEEVPALTFEPFSFEETKAYVRHRLVKAGLTNKMPFNQTAMERIYRISGGIPGKINWVARQLMFDMVQDHDRPKLTVNNESEKPFMSPVRWISLGLLAVVVTSLWFIQHRINHFDTSVRIDDDRELAAPTAFAENSNTSSGYEAVTPALQQAQQASAPEPRSAPPASAASVAQENANPNTNTAAMAPMQSAAPKTPTAMPPVQSPNNPMVQAPANANPASPAHAASIPPTTRPQNVVKNQTSAVHSALAQPAAPEVQTAANRAPISSNAPAAAPIAQAVVADPAATSRAVPQTQATMNGAVNNQNAQMPASNPGPTVAATAVPSSVPEAQAAANGTVMNQNVSAASRAPASPTEGMATSAAAPEVQTAANGTPVNQNPPMASQAQVPTVEAVPSQPSVPQPQAEINPTTIHQNPPAVSPAQSAAGAAMVTQPSVPEEAQTGMNQVATQQNPPAVSPTQSAAGEAPAIQPSVPEAQTGMNQVATQQNPPAASSAPSTGATTIPLAVPEAQPTVNAPSNQNGPDAAPTQASAADATQPSAPDEQPEVQLVNGATMNGNPPEQAPAVEATSTPPGTAVVATPVNETPAQNNPAMHKTGYTLQLLSGNDLNELKGYVQNNHLTGKVSYYQTLRNGKVWYIIGYGQYNTPQEAKAMIAQLSKSLRSPKPWVRPLEPLNEVE